MFSAFRRPSLQAHHPPSTSSHTASSSGSASVADSSSSGVRSPLGNQSNSGWESDVVLHQPLRASAKAVRWNGGQPSSSNPTKLRGIVAVASSGSGYATDAGAVTHHARSRTLSNVQKTTSNASGSSYSTDELPGALDRLLRISNKAFAFAGTVPVLAPISVFFQTLVRISLATSRR